MRKLAKVKARLFFEVLDSKEFELIEDFSSVYDEYFLAVDSPQMRAQLRQQNHVAYLAFIINFLKAIFSHLAFSKLTSEMRDDIIEALKKANYHVKVNDFENSIKTILTRLQMQYDIEIDSLQKMNPKNKITFEGQLVTIENVLGRTIDEDISLAKFIELQKSATSKITKNGTK